MPKEPISAGDKKICRGTLYKKFSKFNSLSRFLRCMQCPKRQHELIICLFKDILRKKQMLSQSNICIWMAPSSSITFYQNWSTASAQTNSFFLSKWHSSNLSLGHMRKPLLAATVLKEFLILPIHMLKWLSSNAP